MSDVILLNGDSRDLIPTLPDDIKCVVCDPPYGVNFVSRRAVTPQGKTFVKAIEDDSNVDDALVLFTDVMDLLLPKCADEAELYVFTAWSVVADWINHVKLLDRHGFAYKMLLVWDKGIPGMGDIDCNWGCGHELILYLKRGRREVPHRRSGIIHVDKLGSKEHIHPTEKPAALIEKLLEMSTDPGDLVVDPFAGSASTLVAAQNMRRRAIGIEKDETHYKRALPRLEQSAFAF